MRLCGVFAVVLCAAATSFGAVNFDSVTGVLTYGSPSDLGVGANIDPADAGLKDVTNSYGTALSDFRNLANVQVVGFNGAPGATQTLQTLVVNNSATSSVTFTFPAAKYNYGAPIGNPVGRGAFSGTSLADAIGTVPVQQADSKYDCFDAAISTTGGQGVQALGFCVSFRNNQAVSDDGAGTVGGSVLFTLSDNSTETITLPVLGGPATNPEYVFIGYQAQGGKTISRVQLGQTAIPGGGYVFVDDLSFVTTAVPEPATLSLLALSGLMIVRRRHA